MAFGESEIDLSELHISVNPQEIGKSKSLGIQAMGNDVQIMCFTEDFLDVTLHYKIIRLTKQMIISFRADLHMDWMQLSEVWSSVCRYGHSTEPYRGCYVLLRGGADNVGSSIARRLVLKTGLCIVLACNIPKDSPMIEAAVERKLVEKLTSLGYIRTKPDGMSIASAGS